MKKLIIKSFLAGLGGALAILCLLLITKVSGYKLIMAPFGASCVILFTLPESPLAQPRNVIGGHIVTAFVGLVAAHYLPHSIVITAIAVGLGISFMILTKTVHPPAGANPLLILLSLKPIAWSFLIFPVAIGSVLLVIIAMIFHKLVTHSEYPLAISKK